jgi:hypothetical protein
MTTQARVLFLAAILALAAGWVGLRRGNDDLAARLAAAEVTP